MERVSWNFSLKAFLTFLPVLLAGLPGLVAAPFWQAVPQKKDILQNPNGTVCLRERSDRYLISLQFPGRDLSKVLVNLSEEILHIEAPAEGSLPAVRRDILVEGASRDGSLSIDRTVSRGLLVVTVPKEEGAQSYPSAIDLSSVSPTRHPMEAVLQEDFAAMISQMQRMQREMEVLTDECPGIPIPSMPSLLSVFPERELQSSIRTGMPRLEDAGDRYLVRVILPGHDLSKVNVNLRDRLLTIDAGNQSSEGSGGYRSRRSSRYYQTMNLPGPVLVGRMKVDRRGDELVVTLPKFGS